MTLNILRVDASARKTGSVSRELNDKIESAAGEVHRMGWIEFQIEVIRKLAAKDEDQYPMNEVWVVPASGGRMRIPAE